MVYWISYFIITLIDAFYCRSAYKGRENIPPKGSYIVVSNHISNIDPFILGRIERRRYSYIAKEDLFKTKFTNWFFHQVGAFPIKRDSSDFRALREALKRLKNGCPLILFPEGTRGTSNRVKKIQPGVGLIAVKSQVPVIPVFLQGSDKALPNDAKWLKHEKVSVTIGKPLTFSPKEKYLTVAERIMDAVYALE